MSTCVGNCCKRFARYAARPAAVPSTGMRSAQRVGRRGYASASHGEAKTSSDLPWLIAAGTITIAGAAYLLTPASKKAAHKVVAGHPTDSAHKGASAEGSKPAPQTSDKPIKDDDGNEASNAEVAASIEQATDANEPKSAKAAEESGAHFDDGAPGQTSAVHGEGDEPEQKEKPSEGSKRQGTFQQGEESGPTDLGKARESGVSAPKQV